MPCPVARLVWGCLAVGTRVVQLDLALEHLHLGPLARATELGPSIDEVQLRRANGEALGGAGTVARFPRQ
jgi:hypothetical protein